MICKRIHSPGEKKKTREKNRSELLQVGGKKIRLLSLDQPLSKGLTDKGLFGLLFLEAETHALCRLDLE